MNIRILGATLGALAVAGGILYWGAHRGATVRPTDIVTAFYPIYAITAEIVGDATRVHALVPFTTEPHDFEPTPRTIASAQTAILFIHSGTYLEPWASRVLDTRNAEGKYSLALVDASNGILYADTDDHAAGGVFDPHIWLSPSRAVGLVDRITAALIDADPAMTETYIRNAKNIADELRAIDADYRATLGRCTQRTIVTDHDAFGYLAADYGLTVRAIRGISPEDEPTPQTLAEITDFVRTNGITRILTEELVSPAVAETLARETGATTAQLSTIEGLAEDDLAEPETYRAKLRGNLPVLADALGCR